MNESSEQISGSMSTSALPSRVTLEDFVEAVTRGITRAVEAQQTTDDTGGFALNPAGQSIINRPILIGIILQPQTPGSIGNVGGRGTSFGQPGQPKIG